MTSADDVVMTWQMTSPRTDVNREHWRVAACGGAWRKLEARDSDAETSDGAWGRVGGPMKTKFHRKRDRRDFFPIV